MKLSINRSQDSGQIIVINSLRGIAALAVCFYHFIVTTKDLVQSELIRDIFYYGTKGVQLFFVISGIVIPLSMIKTRYRLPLIGKYLLRRFIRIEPPYLAAVALGIAYLYLRNFIPSSAQVDLFPSVRDIVLHVGYLIPFVEGAKWINPVFWTLSIEFQYYLYLAILFPLAIKDKQVYKLIFTLSLVLPPLFLESDGFFTHWSAYFGFGIFYTLYITHKYSFTEFLISMLLSTVVVFIAQGWEDLLVAALTLYVIHNFRNWQTKLGLFFGEISYSLYLLHSVIGSSFINFMSHRISGPIETFIVILIGVAISVISAYVFWRLIERPSQIKSKQIKIS